MPQDHLRVFVSYSHDSQEHMDRVLELSDRLRADGIDCALDQYAESPSEGWPRWTLNQISESDFVLVVCTKDYERRLGGHSEFETGVGAEWAGAIVIKEAIV